MAYILSQKTQKNKDHGWYIAPWEGDPGRTIIKENAKKYKTKRGAKIAKKYFEKRFSHIRNIDLEIIEQSKVGE